MPKKRIITYKSILLFLVLVAAVVSACYLYRRNQLAKISESQNYNQTTGFITEPESLQTNQTVITNQNNNQTISQQLPTKAIIKVPFSPQAPFADWSEPYESACEEASIIMVEHYLDKTDLSRDQMKQEIDAAVAWQVENWGSHHDLDASETLKLAQNYFKLSGQVINKPTTDDLKKLLAKGEPVLVPAAGRKLGNPNFRGAGPEYHMLVLIGYDDSQGIFITNDPGTRNGERYIYKYDTFIQSISGPKEDMEKKVLVLSK